MDDVKGTRGEGERTVLTESGEPAPKTGWRGTRARLAVAVVALVLIVGGILFWLSRRGHVSTDDAEIDGHIMPLSARVAGTVRAVHAQDNEDVEAGTILVEIDPTDYTISLHRAQGELDAASAGAQGARENVPLITTNARSQVEAAQSDVASATAHVRAAQAHERETEAKAANAAADRQRLEGLVEKDEVSKQDYAAAVTAAETARADHDAAVAQAREAEAGVRTAEAHLRQAGTAPGQVAIERSHATGAEAQVQQARAAVDKARTDLERTTVRAPVSGVVSKKTVEVGQVVQAGQPLMAVVPLEDIWVTANFKESQLRDVRPGQPVSIKVDAYGRTYQGHVDSIAAATGAKFSLLPPENATGNFVKVVQRVPIKIVFEKGQDPQHLLRPGMSVVPTVNTK